MKTKGDDFLVQGQFYSDIQDINNVNGRVADGETIEYESTSFVFFFFFAQINGRCLHG